MTMVIPDDQCQRVMQRFRKRREQDASITTLTRLKSSITSRYQQSLRKDHGVSGRKRRAPTRYTNDAASDSDGAIHSSVKPKLGYNNIFQCSRHLRNQRYRKEVARLGERLARRNAFGNHANRNTSLSSSHAELVYRKPEDISTLTSYSGCMFLDPYEKILAVDNRGTVDIVKLSDHQAQPDDVKAPGMRSRQIMHHKLVTGLELGAGLDNQQSFSNVYLQTLSGGSTVAIGFGNETLCFMDLEGGHNGCSRYIQCDHNKDCLSRVSLPSSLAQVWKLNHPRRVYYRDRRNERLSMHKLCRKFMSNLGAEGGILSELSFIDYTNGRIPSAVRFVPETPLPASARWDVLETGYLRNSVLYVAHVDSDYDSFWTKVMDGRVPQIQTNGSCNKPHSIESRTTVLADATTKDFPGSSEEHITACALLTERCVATAHISCGNYGSTPAWKFFDEGLPYAGLSGMASCIKLWDLRMNRAKRNQRTSRKSPVPADTIPWTSSSDTTPLFDNASMTVTEPFATIETRLTTGKGELSFSEPTFLSSRPRSVDDEGSMVDGVGTHRVITSLVADRDLSNNASARCGSLIVTTQSRSKPTYFEHSKLDLSGNMRLVRKVSHINVNLGLQPLYSIASLNGFMVTASNNHSPSEGTTTQFCLYNLDQEMTSSGSDRFHQPSPQLHQQCLHDPRWSFHINAPLTDRYGMQSDLSCVALNANGTALLGGTTDGDLFVWRGM